MTGAAVIQDDLDYQQARKVWNADIGQERCEHSAVVVIPFDSPYGEGSRHNPMARITTIDTKKYQDK
jgi:hypothetical protein